MQEIWINTPLIVSIGTLLTLWGYIWKASSFFTKTKQDVANINERLEKIESMNIDTKLTKMDTDLQWIRTTLTKIEDKMDK